MSSAVTRSSGEYSTRAIGGGFSGIGCVAEVASLGGFERQYQIVIDPDRLVGFGLTLTDVTRSVRDANAEVGARVLELAGREYVLRGRETLPNLSPSNPKMRLAVDTWKRLPFGVTKLAGPLLTRYLP